MAVTYQEVTFLSRRVMGWSGASDTFVAPEGFKTQVFPQAGKHHDVVPKGVKAPTQVEVPQMALQGVDLRTLTGPIDSRKADHFYVV